jgi:hypothetical protein
MPKYPDFSNEDVESLYHYIRWRAREDLGCASAAKAAVACAATAN